MRAIQVSQYGGPEVLEPTELPAPVAAADQLLIEVAAAGVNYADTHRTDGSSTTITELPLVPGSEVVGRSADGRRVLATTFEGGGYAELAVVSAADAVDVPDKVGDGEALAMLVQGLTAWHLLRNSARLSRGESVVVNAAAGGVGTLAVQLARYFGAGRVIAVASTEEKRKLAVSLGADIAVASDPEGYAARVIAANDGRPVDVVLESAGGATFNAALGALAGFGRLVTYGNAAREGRRPLIDPALLADHNLTIAGFWLRPALELPGGFREPLAELFDLVAKGKLHPVVTEYALTDARAAHEDLLTRRTTGKLVLRP
jgi:NADPH:quinone reductase